MMSASDAEHPFRSSAQHSFILELRETTSKPSLLYDVVRIIFEYAIQQGSFQIARVSKRFRYWNKKEVLRHVQAEAMTNTSTPSTPWLNSLVKSINHPDVFNIPFDPPGSDKDAMVLVEVPDQELIRVHDYF